MDNDLPTVVLMVLCIIIGALFWFAQVRDNDKHLEAVAACANASGAETGDEWKAAWNACWEASR